MFMFDSKMATVRPYLLLGGAPHEQDYALLRGAGVTHILQAARYAVQVGSELRPSFPDHFDYLRISLDDSEQEDIIRHLPRCFEFIDSARGRNGGSDDDNNSRGCGDGDGGAAPTPPGVVLVHCMAGMSRSATVVVSYLMWSEQLSYTEAFKQVKVARPCIYPNLGFLLQMWEWEAAGCRLDEWPGWNKHRFAERLAEYRRAQAAAGLHPAVRVRLPMAPPDTAATQCNGRAAAAPTAAAAASTATAVTGSSAVKAAAVGAAASVPVPPLPPVWSFEAPSSNAAGDGGSSAACCSSGAQRQSAAAVAAAAAPPSLLPPPGLAMAMGGAVPAAAAAVGIGVGGLGTSAGVELVQC